MWTGEKGCESESERDTENRNRRMPHQTSRRLNCNPTPVALFIIAMYQCCSNQLIYMCTTVALALLAWILVVFRIQFFKTDYTSYSTCITHISKCLSCVLSIKCLGIMASVREVVDHTTSK